MIRILKGDCRAVMATLPPESVHCVVTSPPYWGMRDYGIPPSVWASGWTGCHGLEPQIDLYIANAVEVFRAVRRVLRSDGTLWVNIGDSYCSTDKWGGGVGGNNGKHTVADDGSVPSWAVRERRNPQPGLKPKDLCGVPWRVAFALQADGWWLRQDIIWSKPNPMPESVTDRCTKAHEYIFLLTKSARYFYDADAIKETATGLNDHDLTGSAYCAPGQSPQTGTRRSGNKERKPVSARGVPVDIGGNTNGAVAGSVPWEGSKRNKRSVWTVPSSPFAEAHFATFPPDLIEPMILAGCPKGGTVLDPFFGAGTTGLVCDRLQRDCIGIDLNPNYAKMACDRVTNDAPLFAEVNSNVG